MFLANEKTWRAVNKMERNTYRARSRAAANFMLLPAGGKRKIAIKEQ